MIATILAAAPAGAAMSSTPFVAIFTVFVLAILSDTTSFGALPLHYIHH